MKLNSKIIPSKHIVILWEFSILILHHELPNKNGVVSRRNKTLVEVARSMLAQNQLPQHLYTEAVNTACYTQNCFVVHRRYGKTPFELLFDRVPSVKYFKVFGCKCYVMNEFENKGKFRSKVDEMVFIGYSNISIAYIVYNKHTRILTESINVHFDDHSMLEKKINLSLLRCPQPHSLNDQTSLPHVIKWTRSHPSNLIIGDPSSPVKTRASSANECNFSVFLSNIEPTRVQEALEDSNWLTATLEELNQFIVLKVWRLVEIPNLKTIIDTEWIFNNKKDERGVVIKKKARLVEIGC
ncbi:hypothetical protein OSB04_024723 [Centaurea solstitialis]|uniref:Retroviral polymerase SH3-like domain-containing protein n=1 Tax=Centaurea solstitialis TaxID=347529 RepID=A0AA38WE44_9ASTR|nr:hypothetical protein OSB04_024723 [Centaurea solstitialis]